MQTANDVLVPVMTAVAAAHLPTEYLPVATMLAFPLVRGVTSMLAGAAKLHVADQFRKMLGVAPERSIILEADNALYTKFESYLIKHHLERFRDCQLAPRRGDVAFALNNALLLGPIQIQKDKLKITVSLNIRERDEDKQRVRGKHDGAQGTGLRLTSKSSLEEMRDFVAEVCQAQERENSQLLRIFNSSNKATKKKESNPCWEEVEVVTNRNLSNTIVSSSVKEQLVKDVAWFMSAEVWYNEKGIPYKRGYLLHGPPGTGKTSIVKALAIEYGLPVFSVDMSTIKDNNDFKTLMGEIAYLSRNQRYILSLEDIDRTKMFDKYDRGNITMDCFLNVIDGITESYGRLLFMSANNASPLTSVDALVRPGRIDKIVEISFVDPPQFCAMLEHFYQKPFSVEQVPERLSPAHVINVLQQHPDDPDRALQLLGGTDEPTPTFSGVGSLTGVPCRRKSKPKVTPLAKKQQQLRSIQSRLARSSTQAEKLLRKQEQQKEKDERRKQVLTQQIAKLKEREATRKAKLKRK